MSDHDSDTAGGARWSELYRHLIAPGTTAFALAPHADGPPQRVSSGDAAALITEAERAGAGRAVWAIVAPVRPDLLVLDLDHCADLVLAPILDAVDDASAQLAYLAASGSEDSMHVAIACPTTHSRDALLERVRAIRVRQSLSDTALDIRTADQFLRLPGSASLKGGRRAQPVDVDGRPITALAAAERAHRAVLTLPAGLVAVPAASSTPKAPRPSAVAGTASAATTPSDGGQDDTESALLDTEQPCAWRPRRPVSAEQWRILHRTPDEGSRSHAATAAAWVLWDLGIRGWQRAATWYKHYPAFTKFASRDDSGQAHWRSICARARAHRPQDPDADAVIREALVEVGCWDDPALVAAAVAVITQRYSDGHGIDDRPVAWRDVAVWLSVSVDTAGRRLAALQERGLLVCVAPHDRATAPAEASRYALRVPAAIYRTDLRHDVTHGGEEEPTCLHKIWGQRLGWACWTLWTQMTPTPTPTSALAARTGLRAGSLGHGARRALAALEEAGLAVRAGTGRATRWVRGPASLDAAARATDADRGHRTLVRAIVLEREAWHSPTVRGAIRARRALRALVGEALARRRPETPQPAAQLELLHIGTGHVSGASALAQGNESRAGP